MVRNAKCQANPFGNFMVIDFDDPDRPPARNSEDVQEETDSKFLQDCVHVEH
jgi:hypothetical protein